MARGLNLHRLLHCREASARQKADTEQVLRLTGEVAVLQREVDALRAQLQQAAERELSKAQQIADLTGRAAAAEQSAAAASKARAEKCQAASAELRQLGESHAQLAERLSEEEQRTAQAVGAVQAAQQREQQLRLQLQQREAEVAAAVRRAEEREEQFQLEREAAMQVGEGVLQSQRACGVSTVCSLCPLLQRCILLVYLGDLVFLLGVT